MKYTFPDEVQKVAGLLVANNFETYLVGGCVRDLLIGIEPKDWDITTNARPDQIQKIFPNSIYENEFGTVAVKTEAEDPKLKVIEITTYRKEGRYTDKRHPDEVKFSDKIEDDLARRDFTINAIALNLSGEFVDPFGGQKDIEAKIIKTVGKATERFDEDALRLMRAVRLAAELDFEIEKKNRYRS